MEPCVALVDVVRDDFRRAFFLEALDGERSALELRLAFLSHTRTFAALAGRPSLLLNAVRVMYSSCLRVCAFVTSRPSFSHQLLSPSAGARDRANVPA